MLLNDSLFRPLSAIVFALALIVSINASSVFGQEVVGEGEVEQLASGLQQNRAAPPATEAPSPGIDFFTLLIRGGIFMIPIAVVSLVAVAFAFERLIALRRGRILPSGLVKGLGRIARESEMLDPRATYKLCQQYPSAAANVIRTMLLKIGRPHSEIEAAVKECTQREADKLYANVRWLNLATGVAPLLGLLGTVWGLIVAFHDSTNLGVSSNRAEHLAKGIYEALVTTLAGLMVAIPSAVISHFFEGKISTQFRQIDELMFHLMAQIEQYEGRVRFDTEGRELVARDSASNAAVSTPSTPSASSDGQRSKVAATSSSASSATATRTKTTP